MQYVSIVDLEVNPNAEIRNTAMTNNNIHFFFDFNAHTIDTIENIHTIEAIAGIIVPINDII